MIRLLLTVNSMNSFTPQADSQEKKENCKKKNGKVRALPLADLAVFSMFAALMFCSKQLMEFLPNVHLIGMFTMLLTIVYRKYALIPLYLFVVMQGLYAGFSLWWIPYTYIWTVLWAVTMLLPQTMKDKTAAVVYPLVCALHGLLYGVLYAPAQALLFGLDAKQMLSWIAAGFSFDVLHCVGNAVAGLLILPLSKVLQKLRKQAFYK